MSVNVYLLARGLGLTEIDRWEQDLPHHPKSLELFHFLRDHDKNDFADYFFWRCGGDGDNGETLMYEMDTYFRTLDLIADKKAP